MSKFRRNTAVMAALVFTVGFVNCALAALQTFTFDIAAAFPIGAPVNPVTGSFTLTFDPATSTTGSAVVNALNINYDYGPVSFAYNTTNNHVAIGNRPSGAGQYGVSAYTNQFFLQLNQATGLTPTFQGLIYAQASSSIYGSDSGTVVSTPSIPASPVGIPEPSSLAVLACATMLLVGIQRRA